jgi:hypothetical protein
MAPGWSAVVRASTRFLLLARCKPVYQLSSTSQRRIAGTCSLSISLSAQQIRPTSWLSKIICCVISYEGRSKPDALDEPSSGAPSLTRTCSGHTFELPLPIASMALGSSSGTPGRA